MNQVVQFGRLTRDPELRYTQSGKAVSNFSLAVNRFGQNNEADFFECVAWEKQAENIANSVKKGHRLLIWGRLQQDKWTDQQTGQNRSTIKISVNGFSFIEPRPDQQGQQPPNQPPAYPPAGPPNYQGQPQGQQPPANYPPPGYMPPAPGGGGWQPQSQPQHGPQGQPPAGQFNQPPANPQGQQSTGQFNQPPPTNQQGQQSAGLFNLSMDDLPF